ncbi:MAG: acyltransferase [Ferruginibacter sp.]
MLTTKPARQTWIDYAKGIAIILVLYRHVFEGIKNSNIEGWTNYMFLQHANIMFFSFRMPLFFIVSGVFVAGSLKKRGLQSFIATKTRTILYPYFLWGTLQISLQLIFSKFVNDPPEPKDYLYLFYLPRKIEQFWYLYCLFNVTVLYALAKAVLKWSPIQNIGIGLILYLFSAWAYQNNIILGFAEDIFHYYLFYAIGDAISRLITNPDNRKYLESWKVLLVLLLPFVASQVYYLKANLAYESTNYDFVEYYQPFLYALIALLGCAFIINLAFNLQKLKILNWLHALGRHSLYIYVAHVLVLASVRVFMTKVLHIHNVPVLFASGVILGLLVPVMMYKLAVKMNMRWLFSLEKKRTTLQPVKAVQVQ